MLAGAPIPKPPAPAFSSGMTASGPASPITAIVGLVTIPPSCIQAAASTPAAAAPRATAIGIPTPVIAAATAAAPRAAAIK